MIFPELYLTHVFQGYAEVKNLRNDIIIYMLFKNI